MPDLSADARARLLDYWSYAERDRDAINAEVRRVAATIPAFAPFLKTTSPAEEAKRQEQDRARQRAAFVDGDWGPYLANLHEQGVTFARAGVEFGAWLPLITSLRDVVRARLAMTMADAPEDARRVMDGLNFVLDLALTHLCEAYLEERTREARQSEERYKNLFDASPLPMWVFDLETLAFLAVNEAAVRHYGWTREEFLGMTIREVRPPEDVAELEANVAAARTRSDRESWTHRKKDGTKIQVEISAHLLEFEGRKARLILANDVTAREQARSRSRDLEAQLLQSQKMEAIGRLAGGVAHDFNNMLSVIVGYANMLAGDLKPGDPMIPDLMEIKKAGDRAAALTRQLLAFSRQQVMQPKLLDLNAVVGGMDAMIRRLIGEDVELAPPALRATGKVKADPSQIEQVLMNLVVNARDAMPKGGRLTIETADVVLDEDYAKDHVDVKPGPHLMLAVSDTGHGMDKKTQSRIFEPFFTTKETGKGTGLGLSTVFGIVKQSGGSIWVYSEPGKGTTFKVYLPRSSERSASFLRMSAPAADPGGTETILLVEDEAAVRHIVREVLRRRGYTILEAANAGEALLLSEKHASPIDLLITDVIMPTMSGADLAARLAPTRPAMKVLFMSGYAPDAVVHHGVLEAGAAFLQKPMTPDALLAKVREVLTTRASE